MSNSFRTHMCAVGISWKKNASKNCKQLTLAQRNGYRVLPLATVATEKPRFRAHAAIFAIGVTRAREITARGVVWGNVGCVAPLPCRPRLCRPNRSYVAPTSWLCRPNIKDSPIDLRERSTYKHDTAVRFIDRSKEKFVRLLRCNSSERLVKSNLTRTIDFI